MALKLHHTPNLDLLELNQSLILYTMEFLAARATCDLTNAQDLLRTAETLGDRSAIHAAHMSCERLRERLEFMLDAVNVAQVRLETVRDKRKELLHEFAETETIA